MGLKTLRNIIILLGVFSCGTKKPPLIDQKITLRYVSPGITTIISVSCERFDSAFTDEMKETEFKKGSHDFFLVDSLLGLFRDDTSIKSIDVRVKIIANTKNDSVICMDEMGQFFSASKNKYMKNEPLKKFILDAISSKQ